MFRGLQGATDAPGPFVLARVVRDQILAYLDLDVRQVRALLDERAAAGQPTILVAQHSMTNVFKGVRREMHAAVLYNRDRRFAGLVLDNLRGEAGLVIGDNEPYFVSDETDYTVPRHGEARGLPHVEIEIRQDLIAADAGQDEWARRICRALQSAEHVFLGKAP